VKKRKFTWEAWNYDCDGDAYIIAKSECPDRANLPEWLVEADRLHHDCIPDIAKSIKEGWCAYQCRTDWEYGDGEPQGGYVVETYEPHTKRLDGKRKPGWFPVWIVRKGEWY
jgi:hypothetical protein